MSDVNRETLGLIEEKLQDLIPADAEGIATAENARRILPGITYIERSHVLGFDLGPYDSVVQPYARASLHTTRRVGRVVFGRNTEMDSFHRLSITLTRWHEEEIPRGSVSRRFVDFTPGSGSTVWMDHPSGKCGSWTEAGLLQLLESLQGARDLHAEFSDIGRF